MPATRRTFFSDTLKSSIGLLCAPAISPFAIDKVISNGDNAKAIPGLKGILSSDQLGITLMHEHVLHHTPIPEGKEQESIEYAVKMLNEATRVGIDTLVDLTPGRNIRLYQAIASRVSINVILATGTYLQSRMPEWIVKMSEQEFKEHMRKELTVGIQGTNLRAALIKVAAMSPLTQWDKERFRAAAQLQKELDVPIGTHATYKPGYQFDWLVENGANPNRLYFCHSEAKFGWGGLNRQQMGEEMLRIAKAGGSMLFNNFLYEFDTPWEDLVFLMRLLCERGYIKNVLISMDAIWRWINGKIVTNVEALHPETKQKTLSYAITDAVPALLKAGFSAKDIHTFLVENPARIFS